MENKKRLIDAYKLEDLVRSNSARYHQRMMSLLPLRDNPLLMRWKWCCVASANLVTSVCRSHAPIYAVIKNPLAISG